MQYRSAWRPISADYRTCKMGPLGSSDPDIKDSAPDWPVHQGQGEHPLSPIVAGVDGEVRGRSVEGLQVELMLRAELDGPAPWIDAPGDPARLSFAQRLVVLIEKTDEPPACHRSSYAALQWRALCVVTGPAATPSAHTTIWQRLLASCACQGCSARKQSPISVALLECSLQDRSEVWPDRAR